MGIQLSHMNQRDSTEDIQSFQKSNNGKRLVKDKLLKLYGKQLSNEDLEKFASVLSDVELLKRVYLHTDFEQARQLQKSINEMKLFGTDGESDGNITPVSPNDPLEAFNNAIPKVDPYADMKKNIRVKLVVSETSRTSLERNMKRLVSPFVSFDHFNAPFGFMHIALCIGAWRLEWNTSELCIPRTVQGTASLLAADIESIATLDRLDVIRDKVAECIVRWNTSYLYKQNGGNTQTADGIRYGNCQQFVDDCLNALGINMTSSLPTPLKSYLQKLRVKGYGKMEFIWDENFRMVFFNNNNSNKHSSTTSSFSISPSSLTHSHFDSSLQNDHQEVLSDEDDGNATTGNLQTDAENKKVDGFDPRKYRKKNKIVFSTHSELDQFTHYLLSMDPQFQLKYKYEYYLLKSFDRAFWMRALSTHFGNPQFKPHADQRQAPMCPFGDPRDASILPLKLRSM